MVTSARKLIDAARAEVEELTGHPVDTVSAFERDSDGWRISLEVVELERIPASTNVMATYEALVDGDGSVLEYARVRRYHRNQVDGADA